MEARRDHDGHSAHHAQPRVTVVIPTLNEEASIAAVVRAIPRDLVERVIVADGGD